MDVQSYNFVGNHLRVIREEKSLTIADVANQLRLTKEIINDIENGKYNNKIHTVYLKVYLRSYAKLLAIDEFDVINTLEFSSCSDIGQHKLFLVRKQISTSDKFIQWITFSIISILVVLVALWWKSDNQLNKNT